MSNVCTKIIKQESGRFAIYLNGDFVRDYSRKSDAKIGLKRLLAKMDLDSQSQLDLLAGAAVAAADMRTCEQTAAATAAPPTSNTGGANYGKVSEKYNHFVMVNGELKEIPLKRGVGTSAHIDTLTITLREDVFCEEVETHTEQTKKDLAIKISSTIHTLMGFGILEERKGINGYTYSYRLGTERANYGLVAFGGTKQRNTVMIYFFGEGLTAAKEGWEVSLYNWLQAFAPYAKITRCDLAHDFFNGEYTPQQAYQDWLAGGFTAHHIRPRARMHGYDWLDNQRTGRTFYIGTSNSSKLVRVYDKGCEQGDKQSLWVRVELQMRNRDLVIPHDILIRPGEYLTGAYPIFQTLFSEYQEVPKKTERITKVEIISLEHCARYASMQAAGFVNVMEHLGFSSDEIVKLLKGGKKSFPKRLNIEKYDCRHANVIYLHQLLNPNTQSIEIKDYMDSLYEQEQEEKRQAYFDKLEQEALFHRMQQHYQPHYMDLM